MTNSLAKDRKEYLEKLTRLIFVLLYEFNIYLSILCRKENEYMNHRSLVCFLGDLETNVTIIVKLKALSLSSNTHFPNDYHSRLTNR